MSQPLYNYLGYSLNDIKYINTHKENTYIGISLPKDIYNEETKQYSLFIRITTDFSEEESYFIFQAFFEINDYSWYKKMESNARRSLFFSIVFPFVREKIFSITSDSNPGLFIPTLNIKDVDFEKELRLIKK